ncbi:stemmadenine O-acetyltransferase-like [Andrographis paniculata]|uniref:stemmadenine O-acetyltransferase-like n=1 Tax=Andrographis paniculata TaxID=175694 RepID=UPI0021E6E07F|nr:stemmadenine O-acetyltransferase-like [Andrographis paniculata]
MNQQIETFSTKIIKPSSETPRHLRNLKLSYLDQIVITAYTPIIFFYEALESKILIETNHSCISRHLQQSLANTLASFYPLAGRIKTNSLVECNDAGVDFIEARAHARLTDFVHGHDVEVLKKLLPRDPSDFNGTLVLVKLTLFECGGVSLGFCISHKLADFASIMGFIDAWAAKSRGGPKFTPFTFDLGAYFPARELPEPSSWTFSNENDVANVFVLDKEMLALLKSSATSQYVKNPMRIEMVSAFFWKVFIEVTLEKNPNSKGFFFAFQSINLRPRMNPPPHLENVFGNCYMAIMGLYSPEHDLALDRYHELVRILRDAIKKIDGDFIREAQFGDRYFNQCSEFLALHEKGELREGCAFTSWRNFPLYGVDFGWGNPIWVATAMPMKNSIVLMDTRCGEGIEVWVNMDRNVVKELDKKIDLIRTQMFVG